VNHLPILHFTKLLYKCPALETHFQLQAHESWYLESPGITPDLDVPIPKAKGTPSWRVPGMMSPRSTFGHPE